MEDEEDVDEALFDEVEFARAVLELLKKERAELKKAGLDVDHMIAELESMMQETADAKANLDDLKRRMLMEMSRALIEDKGAPTSSTEQLDMAVNELRKGETAEEYFKRLMRRAQKTEKDSGDA